MSYRNGLVNEVALLLYDIQIQPDSHKIPATDVIPTCDPADLLYSEINLNVTKCRSPSANLVT